MKFKKALRQWFIYVIMPLGIPAVLCLMAWLAMPVSGGQLGGYDFGLLMILAYILVVCEFNLTARQVDADSAEANAGMRHYKCGQNNRAQLTRNRRKS